MNNPIPAVHVTPEVRDVAGEVNRIARVSRSMLLSVLDDAADKMGVTLDSGAMAQVAIKFDEALMWGFEALRKGGRIGAQAPQRRSRGPDDAAQPMEDEVGVISR